MNWYTNDGSWSEEANAKVNTTYSGTPAEFIQAWKMLALSVADNNKVKMFGCPNWGSDIQYRRDVWWPGVEYIHIVGLDAYPRNFSRSFQDLYKPFHDEYALANNIPFAIAETSVWG
jgi:beta-mannanase